MLFDEDKDDKEDQVDFLLLLQKDLSRQQGGDNLLLHSAKELYDMEVIEEDAINQWWANSKSTVTKEMRQVRQPTSQFVDWLNTADDDSEESE